MSAMRAPRFQLGQHARALARGVVLVVGARSCVAIAKCDSSVRLWRVSSHRTMSARASTLRARKRDVA